ncbi:MAG: phosphoribosyltransferase [Bacillota bacterium]|jgi:predicted phosphoribosyltransferase|nr:phosphoribosyltransferase [Bacillota bacterium]
MLFADRYDAGRRLAEKLSHYQGKNPLILAVPRGGIPVAYEILQVTGGRLDLVIPRKLSAPQNPELALGAVAPDGTVVLEERIIRKLGVSQEYIREEVSRQLAEIEGRLERYRGSRPFPNLAGEIVLVVDDGVATGATLRAALKMVRGKGARSLILAVPVGPPETIAALGREVDEVVCLATPELFYAVGQFYQDFSQTSDREVADLLQQVWDRQG